MNTKPTTSLVISTYNWPEALSLVFKSIRSQSVYPNEVIIADDGSGEETQNLINSFRKEIDIPVIHVWHEDNGFRKTIIMNKAIEKSSGDYIIQIDGDIILHPDFIKDHIEEAEEGCYIKGSRAMISASKAKEIVKTLQISFNFWSSGIHHRLNAIRFPWASKFLHNRNKRSDNVKGCNCAFWKNDFVNVNGYNNDLTGWGHEDIELAARLVNSGVLQKQVKLKAICFHIYHKLNSRHCEDINMSVYRQVVKNHIVKCKNGFKSLVTL